MKRLIFFIFYGILLFATGCADKIEQETECTKAIAFGKGWTICADGTLTISIRGRMNDYRVLPDEYLAPWFEFREDITSVIIGNDVTYIGSYSFFRCENLTSVTFGKSVKTIGYRAFLSCNGLIDIDIPNTVTNINDGAFAGCKNLTSITIPNSVTDMGKGTFYDCIGLTSVVIPNSVNTIGQEIFYNCSSLTSATIPNSVTTIENLAFHSCSSLNEIINYQEMPQMINGNVFINVSKTNCILLVPDGSVDAYRNADVWKSFYKTGVIGDPASVMIGGKIENLSWTLTDDGTLTVSGAGSIPNYSQSRDSYPPWDIFSNSIIKLLIEDGVTVIGNQAFQYCVNLLSVTIPNSVTNINNNVFTNCSGLKEFISYATKPPAIGTDVFNNKLNFSECILFVPVGCESAYHTANGWKEFTNITEID